MSEENKVEETGNEETGNEEKKPMISAEYRKEYANKPKDWIRNFVEEQCYGPEELPEDSKKKAREVADVDKMVKLASVNGINVEKFNTDAYNNGQKVMNINNILRSHAKKRHGLKNLDGKFCAIPADDPLVAGSEPTHDSEGNVIRQAAKDEKGEPIKKH